jgi:predicted transcriptional regulator
MHRGEIIEKAVRDSSVALSELARRLKVSRKTIYNIFERYDVDMDIVYKIGEIIHYDFSMHFPTMKNSPEIEIQKVDNSIETTLLKKEIEYWKDKYIVLLEEHNKLLKR